jgi:glycosyltransferase involved in cell wall biosynthesis
VLAVLDSTGAGGAETSTALMAPLLREMGVDFQIAFFHDRGGVKQRLIDDGVPIHHVPAGRSRVVSLLRLIRLICDVRPDVVHTAVYEADIIGRTAGWLCRVPVVSSIISDMYGPEHRSAVGPTIKLYLAWAADILTARLVRRFHAVSAAVASSVSPRLLLRADRVAIIPRGRQPPRPEQVQSRSYLEPLIEGLTPDTIVVLAVGRHDRAKDFATLIKAVAMLTEPVHLLVAGADGGDTTALHQLVDDGGLGASVTFLGERSDVYELMTAVDVVAFPSRREGLPGVALESLAAGCRSVCSDLPVYREVFDTGDGRYLCEFIPVGDHRALATCLSSVVAGSEHSEMMTARQELFRRRFRLDRIAAQFVDLYAFISDRRELSM